MASSSARARNDFVLIHGRYRLKTAMPICQSDTSIVFEGLDEGRTDEDGNPVETIDVALKFISRKSQFRQEIDARHRNLLDGRFVLDVIRTHPKLDSSAPSEVLEQVLGGYPDRISLDAFYNRSDDTVVTDWSMTNFENLFLIVMPLADRNLFDALKLERFAGKNLNICKRVIREIIECVKHMHEKGLIHGDIKPLNIVRRNGRWLLIDLDSTCSIDVDCIGSKTSSAYIPPEAICASIDECVAVIRSNRAYEQYGEKCERLVAQASFDVWSIGCIFYQLVSKGAAPMWYCDQDDNLAENISQTDNLVVLSKFSDELKEKKLFIVEDPLARNVLSQMLMKDPRKRPSLATLLEHPFFTGKKVVRMVGEKAKYDVYLSYRSSSDRVHALLLYKSLASAGLTVFLDEENLELGVSWEQGCFDGLVDCKAFVSIMSRDAIRDYAHLTLQSSCDNVLLQQRMALEFKERGLIQYIFPLFVGQVAEGTCTTDPPCPALSYKDWNWAEDLPMAPETHVQQLEDKLVQGIDNLALGKPLQANQTVKATLQGISDHLGFFLQGDGVQAFEEATKRIIDMVARPKPFKKYDVYLSFRQDSDKTHAYILYNSLASAGYTVFCGGKEQCLRDGFAWLQDCLVARCNAFVSIMSRDAINHPTVFCQNYANLNAHSPNDNILFEQRMALELKERGMIKIIIPLFVGQVAEGTCTTDPPCPALSYKDWNWTEDSPMAPETHVQQLEDKLMHCLDHLKLGKPHQLNQTVKATLDGILSSEGIFVTGDGVQAFEEATNMIIDKVKSMAVDPFHSYDASKPPCHYADLFSSLPLDYDQDRLYKTLEKCPELTMHIDHNRGSRIIDLEFKSKEDQIGLALGLNKFRRNLALPTSMSLSYQSLSYDDNALWFYIVQREGMDERVMQLVRLYPDLAEAQDRHGRKAADVATPTNVKAINSVILIHGRYRLCTNEPAHQSTSCLVFEATDENSKGDNGYVLKVALKFMFVKEQFMREVSSREYNFDKDHVIDIIRTHPDTSANVSKVEINQSLSSFDDHVHLDVHEASSRGYGLDRKKPTLTKENAEKLFLVVMPLAERNLFVAMKHERFAGKDMGTVRHTMKCIMESVKHIHEKRVLHSDIKPLNIMRKLGEWMLIDLDAASSFDDQSVGFKSSSAYIPPEAIYVDADETVAVVRSDKTHEEHGEECKVLMAHPSFDVWSLGCILYQLVNEDVLPLWQCGQDDNLSNDKSNPDSLFALQSFSYELKTRKLSIIKDPQARNLLSRMLNKDPAQRLTLERVLAHPFISGRKTARMPGEAAKHDVFISYRVASEATMAQVLFDELTAMGYSVYLDKECLEPGISWEEGFCEGLVNSCIFVPLLSQAAINHPEKTWQNFSKLTEDSNCDNVLLEHRLALELVEFGLLSNIFPIFIGNTATTVDSTDTLLAAFYQDFFACGGKPSCSDVCVKSIELKTREFLEGQGLGTPIVADRTVKSIYDNIAKYQGQFIKGEGEKAVKEGVGKIREMVEKLAWAANKGEEKELGLCFTVVGDETKLIDEYKTLSQENQVQSKEIVKLRDQLSLSLLSVLGPGGVGTKDGADSGMYEGIGEPPTSVSTDRRVYTGSSMDTSSQNSRDLLQLQMEETIWASWTKIKRKCS